MLKNYLNVTLRNIRKNRGYSFIIIFGLALSLSLSLLITQMIYNFNSFDRFHENKDRIYRLVTTRTGENRTEDFATAPFPMASALTDTVPGIEASTVWMWGLGGNAIGRGKVYPLHTSFAGEWNLVKLLSRHFMGMLAVAVAPAIPLAWWFNGVLLSLYDKRVGMRAELFILGACLVMVLGMGMVLSQTIRAARTDPVDIIRYE